MKKLLLCGTALLFSLGLVKAQGWNATGAHDDFATSTQYDDGTGKGIFWFETSAGLTLTRGTGSMTISGTGPAATTYPLFGLDFGTGNSVNLSTGADIQIDIENSGSVLLFVKIELEDTDGDKSDIEPDVTDVTSMDWSEGTPNRKANNGFTLAAGQRKTITIDLSSVPAYMGGLTRTGWGGSGPADSPITTYAINPAAVKAVLFTLNYGSDPSTFFSEGDGNPDTDTEVTSGQIVAYTGDIIIRDFRIGSSVIAGVNGAAMIDNSLSVYPNPANEVLSVEYNSAEKTEVSLSNVLGTKVFSTTSGSGESKIAVNTSDLSSGIYILNIATENGMVTRKVTIK